MDPTESNDINAVPTEPTGVDPDPDTDTDTDTAGWAPAGTGGEPSWAPRDWGRPAPAEGGAADDGAARTVPPPLAWVRLLEESPALDAWADKVRPLADLLSDGRAGKVLGGAPLGHALHPLLTDVPIGCWTSAGVLDLVGGKRSRVAARRLTGLGVLAVLPTALSGWSDFGRLGAAQDRRVGVVHAAGNATAAVLHLGSWRARRRGRHLRGVVLGMAGNTVATAAGYLGGHLAIGRAAGSGERTTTGPVGGTVPPAGE